MISTIKTIPESQLRELVKSSTSRSDVFRKLGMRKSGSTFATLNACIKKLGVSTDHFKRGCQTGGQLIPLKEILIKGSTYNSNDLRKRLIADGILKNNCSECGMGPTWNNKPIVLPMDHINGDKTDQRIENLRILCPNCHTQTPTFGYKKRV